VIKIITCLIITISVHLINPYSRRLSTHSTILSSYSVRSQWQIFYLSEKENGKPHFKTESSALSLIFQYQSSGLRIRLSSFKIDSMMEICLIICVFTHFYDLKFIFYSLSWFRLTKTFNSLPMKFQNCLDQAITPLAFQKFWQISKFETQFSRYIQ
jgi:hypothetical protein